MPAHTQFVLVLAAIATAAAALAHFACIPIGSRAYRVMGAGDRAVRAVERGRAGPHVVAFGVGCALLGAAAYALSGAGFIPRLPLLRSGLFAIAFALLTRAFAFPLLRARITGNSERFWRLSSAACLALGACYLAGAFRS